VGREAVSADMSAAAKLLGISRRTFFRHDVEGLLPRCVRPGGRRYWSRVELERWIAAGCPPRARWEAMKGGH
jgi:predicted DNA-binding transcriptional regulator AlpA